MPEAGKQMSKCGNAKCACETTETYCSDYCRNPRGINPACECGHPQCESGLASTPGHERV